MAVERMDLLERESELATLDAAIEPATSGHGGAVLIEAPAGLGKSALLSRAASAAQRAGMRVLRASGGEHERDFAFGAVRQLFEPVLARRSQAQRAVLLGGSAAAAAAVVEPVAAVAEAGFPLLHALFWLVANLVAEQPLALLVDDLHWVDEASLRTLDFVIRRAGELPLLVVATLRPAEPGAHTGLLDALRDGSPTVGLAALSPDAVTAIVRDTRPDADRDVAAAYREASGGNPLYLRELLRAVPHGDAAAVRAATIPALGGRVLRRIAAVAPEAPALAAATAVLGDGQPLSRVLALAGLDPAVGGEAARGLVGIDVLSGDDPCGFTHPLLRHSVYAQISAARRAALHAGAADLLEAAGADTDAIAAQLVALPAAGSSAVASRLRDAGLAALGRGAPEVAARRLRRALDEGAAEPTRPQLLFDLGRAEAATRDPGCIPHLQEAFDAASGLLRADVAVVLAELLGNAGAWDEAASLIDEALPLAPPASPAHGYLTATRAVLHAHDLRRNSGFHAAWAENAAFASGQSWGALATASVLAAHAAQTGRPREEVLALTGHAMAGGRLFDAHAGGSWAPIQVVTALIAIDELDAVDDWAASMAAAGRRTGAALPTLGAFGSEVWSRARRGDLSGAEATVATALGFATESGMAMWVTSCAFYFRDLLAERPSLDALADQIDAVELPAAFGATASGAMLLDARARIALARGDRVKALALCRELQPLYEAMRTGPALTSWRSQFAVALAPDDPAAATALAVDELRLARASGYPRSIGVALRTVGSLTGDDAPLRESLAVLAATPAALERVYTQLELGALLRRSHRIPEAREHLAAAVDGARRCGADRTLRRATDELVAAGARPRRAASTGREALTPRELRIAELAAGGRTNAEIAQELFVSVKTVEAHLSNVYGKLGLSGRGSRSALASALAPSPGA